MAKRKNKATPELDLHGIKHADVHVKVEDFVLGHVPPVRIVTGNSKAMKNIVVTVLNKHGYSYSDMFPASIMVLSE